MPWIKMQDGTVAHICTRGSRNPIKACVKCSAISTKLCDFKLPNRRTCDKPLCDRCAVNVGPNKDYCPDHPQPATTPNLLAEHV
jgi:hypothetical protein